VKATRNRTYVRIPIEDRLFAKLAPGPNGCLEFMGARYPFGHGQISVGGSARRMVRAHRVAWEMHNGPIPEGLYVCHTCDNPPCCNPEHLYVGTKADNMNDMSRRRRAKNSKKTHCAQGHEFTPENTAPRYDTSSGRPGRRCRTCREASNRRKSPALKQAA
jgi:hypothetical protein